MLAHSHHRQQHGGLLNIRTQCACARGCVVNKTLHRPAALTQTWDTRHLGVLHPRTAEEGLGDDEDDPPWLATDLEVSRRKADANAASITPVADVALEVVHHPPPGDRPVGKDAANVVLVLPRARIAHTKLVLLHLKIATACSGVKVSRRRL